MTAHRVSVIAGWIAVAVLLGFVGVFCWLCWESARLGELTEREGGDL